MKNINPDKINDYIDKLIKQGYDNARISAKIGIVDKFINWASLKGKIPIKTFEQVKTLLANRQIDLEHKINDNKPSESPVVDQNALLHNHSAPQNENYSSRNNAYDENDTSDINRGSRLRQYLVFALVVIFISLFTTGMNNHLFNNQNRPLAYSRSVPTTSRTLSFKGRLNDTLGNPITSETHVVFKIHSATSGGSQLYTSGTCSIIPDENGRFSTVIGKNCGSEISNTVFTDHTNVYLGITVGSDSEMTPRQQIANVGYTLGAETISGHSVGQSTSTIPYIDNQGDVQIAATSPSIVSNYASETFLIGSANAVTLQSAGAGDITLTASESGMIKFLTGGNQAGVITNTQHWGLGTTNPDAKLDSLSTAGEQLRLTYSDGSVYSGFTTNSSGNLTIDASGGKIITPDDLVVNGGDITTSSSTLNIDVPNSGSIQLRQGTNTLVSVNGKSSSKALDVEGEIQLDLDTEHDTSIGVCKDSADGSMDVVFRECSGSPSDIAEYYRAEADLRPGDIVAIGESHDVMTAVRTSRPYQLKTFGIVSTYPVGQFGKPLGHNLYQDQFASAIGLAGRLPVKISLENGPVVIGDPLTTSSTPGVAMKANKPGTIIGMALENYDGSTIVSAGVRQQEDLRRQSQMKFNLDPIDPIEQGIGKILVFSNITYFSPETLIYDGLEGQERNVVLNFLTSLPEITLNIIDTTLLKAQHLIADSITAGNATIDSIIAKTITTNTLRATNITSDSIVTKDASISGTLSAKKIESENLTALEEDIANNSSLTEGQQHIVTELRERLKKVADEGTLNKDDLSHQVNDIQQTLKDIENDPLPDPQYYQNLDTQSVSSLTISNDANIYNLFVTNVASLGNIMIQDNTISSSMSELKLTALESINLLDGAVIIAKDGTITTKGALIAKGGVQTNDIKSIDKSNVAVTLEKNADPTMTNEFQIKNNDGTIVSSITDQGMGRFSQLQLDSADTATTSATIIAASDNLTLYGIDAPAIMTNTASSGTAQMPGGSIDLVVYNDKISPQSLVYITPTTPTQNNNLFVAYTEPCTSARPNTTIVCKPFFKVSLDNKISTDVKFNWLIINGK